MARRSSPSSSSARAVLVAFAVAAATAAVALPSSTAAAAPRHARTEAPKKTAKGKPSAGKKAGKAKPAAKKVAAPKEHAAPKTAASEKKAADEKAQKPTTAAKGAGTGTVDQAARSRVAGAGDDASTADGALPPELVSLRALERELFPELFLPGAGARPTLPSDAETGPIGVRPVILSSGLAPSVPGGIEQPASPTIADEPRDGYLALLAPTSLSSRWDPRLLRYLRFFHDNPRGRSMVQIGFRKSGKYGELIRAAFRAEGVPEELIWLAMVESAFEPTVKSHAGAAGMFQFMPDGARQYGLRLDRFTDERKDPSKSATAAAKYLADLHKRFGTWELALAAYNMGHGALLSAVRKYSTNDFWELARLEAGLPFETAMYVPKILALAIVEKNQAEFGLALVPRDPPLAASTVSARGGISLDTVATAAGVPVERLVELNPHLRTSRTPLAPRGPDTMGSFALNVPTEAVPQLTQRLPRLEAKEPAFVEHTVRLGQSVRSLAADLNVARAKIVAWNGLDEAEPIKAGDVLMLPAEGVKKLATPAVGEKPVVVVPQGIQSLPGHRRVFYRVTRGDALRSIATAFGVDEADLAEWNTLDPEARLQDGMTLQLFVDNDRDLSRVVSWSERDVSVLVVSSDEFFAYFEEKKGRRRVEVVCAEKDTWATIGARYKVSVGLLERINARSRSTPLKKGDRLVVYTGLGESDPVFQREAPLTGKALPDTTEAVVDETAAGESTGTPRPTLE
jgi:membrane-bound lytic murein transglycosylase D